MCDHIHADCQVNFLRSLESPDDRDHGFSLRRISPQLKITPSRGDSILRDSDHLVQLQREGELHVHRAGRQADEREELQRHGEVLLPGDEVVGNSSRFPETSLVALGTELSAAASTGVFCSARR